MRHCSSHSCNGVTDLVIIFTLLQTLSYDKKNSHFHPKKHQHQHIFNNIIVTYLVQFYSHIITGYYVTGLECYRMQGWMKIIVLNLKVLTPTVSNKIIYFEKKSTFGCFFRILHGQ